MKINILILSVIPAARHVQRSRWTLTHINNTNKELWTIALGMSVSVLFGSDWNIAWIGMK